MVHLVMPSRLTILVQEPPKEKLGPFLKNGRLSKLPAILKWMLLVAKKRAPPMTPKAPSVPELLPPSLKTGTLRLLSTVALSCLSIADAESNDKGIHRATCI